MAGTRKAPAKKAPAKKSAPRKRPAAKTAPAVTVEQRSTLIPENGPRAAEHKEA